jgi:carbonic anhydrase
MKIVVVLLLFFCCSVWAEGGNSQVETWGYSENGNDWAGTCKSGIRQSPINVLSKDVGSCKILNSDVSLTFLNTEVEAILKLEDQTLRESFTNKIAFLTAPDLNGIVQSYSLSNLHFHTYSEHQVDSVNSKLEMHLVSIFNPILKYLLK